MGLETPLDSAPEPPGFSRGEVQIKPVAGHPLPPFQVGHARLEHAEALTCYPHWPAPTSIIVDGPYGLGKYPGEPKTPTQLAAWYTPHVAA